MRLVRLFAVLAMATGALAPTAAGAAITTPGSNATVRGDVKITEGSGGSKPFYCDGAGVDSTITVTRLSDNVVVFTKSKGGSGGWTATWVSHGLANGAYKITSTAVSKNLLCQIGAPETLSTISVTLDNVSTIVYSGATTAGVAFPFEASARLFDSTTGRAIEGRQVDFTIDGTPAGSCLTDTTGSCSTPASALTAPGSHTITTTFAGDCCWRSSQDSDAFVVTPLPPCAIDPATCLPEPPGPAL